MSGEPKNTTSAPYMDLIQVVFAAVAPMKRKDECCGRLIEALRLLEFAFPHVVFIVDTYRAVILRSIAFEGISKINYFFTDRFSRLFSNQKLGRVATFLAEIVLIRNLKTLQA